MLLDSCQGSNEYLERLKVDNEENDRLIIMIVYSLRYSNTFSGIRKVSRTGVI